MEGFFSESFTTLTTGAVQTGVALALGAGPIALALLAGLPYLAQFGQLAGPAVEGRFQTRRRYVVPALVFGRTLWLVPILCVAMGWTGSLPLFASMVAITAMAFIHMLGQNGWTAWMAEIVPDAQRARVFARRHWGGTVATGVCATGAGLALDHGGPPEVRHLVFAVLGLSAVGAGAFGGWLMRQFPDAPVPDAPTEPYLQRVRRLVDAPGFRRLMGFSATWHLAIGLPLPFWQLYMLQQCKMSYLLISCHVLLSLSFRLLTNRLWAYVLHRLGSTRVLCLCAVGICVMPINWMFVSPDNYTMVFVDAVLSGTLWAGFIQAWFIQPLEAFDEQDRTLGLGLFHFTNGAILFVSTLLGGVILRFFGTEDPFGFYVLFAASSMLRLYSGLRGFRVLDRRSTLVEAFRELKGARPARAFGTDTWPPDN
jgi:hypothetical protein